MVRLLYGLARTSAPYYSSCSYYSTNDQSSPTFRSFQVVVVGVVGGVVVDDGAKVLAAAEVQLNSNFLAIKNLSRCKINEQILINNVPFCKS